jgi:hypothetical protein
MSTPIMVQVDNDEHKATPEEQEQIEIIRAGSVDPFA